MHPCGKPGASGSVFKIEYQGKPAAAKRFHEHMRDMLSRELKSLQLLAHPNIVRVMAVVTDAASQPVGFIMEYVPVSLDDAMQRMTLRQAVHALVEASIGVAVAHDANVIHSDIKPGNILLSEDFTVIKLADFGLAHAISASISALSGVRGTALYMAPELHEDAPLSVATDIFSFGMTTWQLLHAGVADPLGKNIVTVTSKLAKGQRPPFTRVDAPPALKGLVARCLAHDPPHRPASMWEVYRELKAILLQLPDTSAPTNLATLLSQPTLQQPPQTLPSGATQLVDEAATSDFATFLRARMRREAAGVSVSRVCRVVVGSSRMAFFLHLFMREANSRSSNAKLRPANATDAACVAGLNKLKSLFERTCLGASPPCNIVLAWHGTSAQYVPSSLSITTAVPFSISCP
jgi:serine/threonine protein kinase